MDCQRAGKKQPVEADHSKVHASLLDGVFVFETKIELPVMYNTTGFTDPVTITDHKPLLGLYI